MSIDTTTQALPDTSASERATRLAAAGTAWSDRIRADRAAARLRYRVTGSGEGAVATRLQAGAHTFWIDEPAGLAGDDVAASPVEVALGALVACQVVVYRLYAQALSIPFDDIDITAEGDLDAARLLGEDETVRAGFTEVRLEIRIDGPESPERYEALKAAVETHCPVLDLFANPTPVSATLVQA